MKKLCLVLALWLLGSNAYADDTGRFIQDLRADRLQKIAQLGLNPQLYYPQASSYYDDRVDLFEQEQIRLDRLGEGLR